MDTFGKRLRYAKDKKGLTNKELAKMMGKKSPSTIISWEDDKSEITMSQLKELSRILEVTVGFLMDGENAKSVVDEPMEGYVLIKKDDLIELQAQKIEIQKKQIADLKNANSVVE